MPKRVDLNYNKLQFSFGQKLYILPISFALFFAQLLLGASSLAFGYKAWLCYTCHLYKRPSSLNGIGSICHMNENIVRYAGIAIVCRFLIKSIQWKCITQNPKISV